MNVLVLAAHPDDEVLGCGGNIARLSAEGNIVNIAILGEGISSRYGKREQADSKLIALLQGKSRQVAELLGARELVMLGLPDNRFDGVSLLDIAKEIEVLIDRFQPEAVYTQHGGDLNIDHQRLFQATLTATRPVSGIAVKNVYAYPVASSTEWAFQSFSPQFRPNVFVDISATLEKKIKAMQGYESEARPFPHPRSPEALRAAALSWGSVAALPAAEPFELIRSIR